MKNIHCDECDKKFAIKLKEKKHGKGVTETYFVCPHCKSRYTAFVLNADARRMQREIKGLHHTSVTASSEQERAEAVVKMGETKRKLKVLMDELKGRL